MAYHGQVLVQICGPPCFTDRLSACTGEGEQNKLVRKRIYRRTGGTLCRLHARSNPRANRCKWVSVEWKVMEQEQRLAWHKRHTDLVFKLCPRSTGQPIPPSTPNMCATRQTQAVQQQKQQQQKKPTPHKTKTRSPMWKTLSRSWWQNWKQIWCYLTLVVLRCGFVACNRRRVSFVAVRARVNPPTGYYRFRYLPPLDGCAVGSCIEVAHSHSLCCGRRTSKWSQKLLLQLLPPLLLLLLLLLPQIPFHFLQYVLNDGSIVFVVALLH